MKSDVTMLVVIGHLTDPYVISGYEHKYNINIYLFPWKAKDGSAYSTDEIYRSCHCNGAAGLQVSKAFLVPG